MSPRSSWEANEAGPTTSATPSPRSWSGLVGLRCTGGWAESRCIRGVAGDRRRGRQRHEPEVGGSPSPDVQQGDGAPRRRGLVPEEGTEADHDGDAGRARGARSVGEPDKGGEDHDAHDGKRHGDDAFGPGTVVPGRGDDEDPGDHRRRHHEDRRVERGDEVTAGLAAPGQRLDPGGRDEVGAELEQCGRESADRRGEHTTDDPHGLGERDEVPAAEAGRSLGPGPERDHGRTGQGERDEHDLLRGAGGQRELDQGQQAPDREDQHPGCRSCAHRSPSADVPGSEGSAAPGAVDACAQSGARPSRSARSRSSAGCGRDMKKPCAWSQPSRASSS